MLSRQCLAERWFELEPGLRPHVSFVSRDQLTGVRNLDVVTLTEDQPFGTF